MRPTPPLAALAALALALPAAAEELPFASEGEVVFRGSAAYDASRVRGPKVNLALTRDGKWGGNLLDKDVVLDVKPDRISGAGVNLVVSRDAGSLSVEGLVSGIRVRVKATRDRFTGRVGDRQVEAVRGSNGIWSLSGGESRTAVIRFKGSADRLPDVPMPQWIFAVLESI